MLPGQDIPSHSQVYLCMPQDPGRWFLVFYLFLAILGFQCGEIYGSILRRQVFVAYIYIVCSHHLKELTHQLIL